MTDRDGAPSPDRRDDGAVRAYSCSRVGMRANPPGIRLPFGGWLRRA